MQLGGTSQEAVRGSLRGLGYDDALIRADWTPHDVVGSANPITLPLTAFWSKPYDQFRSAIAVVADGGVAPRQAAQRSMSHVLQCKDQTATLWLLGEADLVRKDHAPIGQLEGLLNAHRDEVERDTVARTKMRLRQYALYEADPHGHAFWQWVIRPTIDQASSRLENLVAKAKSRWDLDVPTEDWARWLFRVVALRVGLDGNWSVTKGLGREDVRGFVQRAEQYPSKWRSTARLSHEQRRDIVELALDILQYFNFETVDHLFVSKAVGAAALQPLRKAIDLFPTPKPFAWDMMASIPLTKDVGVCDATAGTGTFLIAAGHAIWANYPSQPDLRSVLRGADTSPFSADLSEIGLDLAFGYDDAGWSINVQTAKQEVTVLPDDREWVLVGNPPWAGRGTAPNTSSEILSHYVDALLARKRGWIALVLPRVVLTNRLERGRQMRTRIAAEFQLESVWDMPFASIPGGRSQGVAISLSLGKSASTTVWKQLDTHGRVHTVGYRQSNGIQDFFASAHTVFLQSKFANFSRLDEWFNARRGVALKSRKDRQPIPEGGDVPFLEGLAELKIFRSDPRDAELDMTLLRMNDVTGNEGWIERNYDRPARDYRRSMGKLPHVIVPRTVYEGVDNLCCSVLVAYRPVLVNEAFMALIPKVEMSEEFIRGVGVIMSSLLARLWIHLRAHAGRHVSIGEVKGLPLPDREAVEHLGVSDGGPNDPATVYLHGQPCLIFKPGECFERELRICSAYGLDTRESAAVLALSHHLGHQPSGPEHLERTMDNFKTDQKRLDQLRRQARSAKTDREHSRLYLAALAEEQKDDYLIVGTDHCQLSIEKSSLGQYHG